MLKLTNDIIDNVKWYHLVIAVILMAGTGFFMNNNPWIADYALEDGMLNFTFNFSPPMVKDQLDLSTAAERAAHNIVLTFDYFVALFSSLVLMTALALLVKKAHDEKDQPILIIYLPLLAGITNCISNIMLQLVNSAYPDVDLLLLEIASRCTSVKLVVAVFSLFFIIMFSVQAIRRKQPAAK